MKKALCLLVVLVGLSACSIRQAAYNSVSDMLAPPPGAKPSTGPNPMIALTGENDPQLVKDFFPTALKMYEIMMIQNPKHTGIAIMTGQLYIMYANAFVQTPAEQLPIEQFSRQNAEYIRAQNFYTRGKNFVLKALELDYPGFSAAVFGSDPAATAEFLGKCGKNDTAALYWAGAGALGAFSLAPLDGENLATLPGSVTMLERAATLDPAFNKGAIWEVLLSFYAAAPEDMGGGREKALEAYQKALQYTGGTSPGTYMAYARGICIPTQDSAGFDEALDKALAIDPESQPDNRLVLTIAHQQAQWLKEHKADYILE